MTELIDNRIFSIEIKVCRERRMHEEAKACLHIQYMVV